MTKTKWWLIGLVIFIILISQPKKVGDMVIPGYCRQESLDTDVTCGVTTGYGQSPIGQEANWYRDYEYPEGMDFFWTYGVHQRAIAAKIYFHSRIGGSHSEVQTDIPPACMDYDPGFIHFKANFFWDSLGGTSHNDWIRIYCQNGLDVWGDPTWHFLVSRETHGYSGAFNRFVDEDMHWDLAEYSYTQFMWVKGGFINGGDFQQFIDEAYYWVDS